MVPTVLLILASVAAGCLAATDKPHVMFVVADDMGWGDIGWNNPEIITPNLDRLAKNGIILDNNYVQPVCSPSRAAFFTGTYPYRMGLQHRVIESDQAVCVPLDKKYFPKVLKDNGYATHMIGKWHQGFCKIECTPTYRGFDTFFGFYNGGQTYYTKSTDKDDPDCCFDFRNNTEVYREAAGNDTDTDKYSTLQYAERMEQLVQGHDTEKPMFLYLAFQNVHTPYEVPKRYLAKNRKIKKPKRRVIAAMATLLDEVVGRLETALQDKGMLDNTLIIFTSDNGGDAVGGSSNAPLRGSKATIFEGGTRVPGFVYGKMVNTTEGSNAKFTGLMHATDWYKTILKAADIDYDDPELDSIDQWDSINSRENGQQRRNEVIYNLDYSEFPLTGKAAIRIGDWKLIDGYPGVLQALFKPNGKIGKIGSFWDALEEQRNPSGKKFQYLYNLKDDPYESTDLYDKYPDKVAELRARIQEEKDTRYIPANYPERNDAAHPSNFGGVWSTGWC